MSSGCCGSRAVAGGNIKWCVLQLPLIFGWAYSACRVFCPRGPRSLTMNFRGIGVIRLLLGALVLTSLLCVSNSSPRTGGRVLDDVCRVVASTCTARRCFLAPINLNTVAVVKRLCVMLKKANSIGSQARNTCSKIPERLYLVAVKWHATGLVLDKTPEVDKSRFTIDMRTRVHHQARAKPMYIQSSTKDITTNCSIDTPYLDTDTAIYTQGVQAYKLENRKWYIPYNSISSQSIYSTWARSMGPRPVKTPETPSLRQQSKILRREANVGDKSKITSNAKKGK